MNAAQKRAPHHRQTTPSVYSFVIKLQFPRLKYPRTTWHSELRIMTESKVQVKLLRCMGEAIADFGMIEDGDRVMVCLSGGKDSHTLLDLLIDIRRRAPVHLCLLAVNLDQKQPGFPADVLPAYLSKVDVPFRIVGHDTYT